MKRTFVWLLHALASLSSTRQVMLRSPYTVCAGQGLDRISNNVHRVLIVSLLNCCSNARPGMNKLQLVLKREDSHHYHFNM